MGVTSAVLFFCRVFFEVLAVVAVAAGTLLLLDVEGVVDGTSGEAPVVKVAVGDEPTPVVAVVGAPVTDGATAVVPKAPDSVLEMDVVGESVFDRVDFLSRVAILYHGLMNK